ncbi:ABC transporter permease [Tsukamurella paurometabola]|uniref:ABC transporter permease n=1 Tax=Tsukamurella paurometabola TaxID=2061 RepID=A0ABS5NJM1_TSUPA|nr:ABC transporter permease [Tsukamurella paurometabola]MBS4104215.1 ABC transporter permease [Tsukamurella paurometabola]
MNSRIAIKPILLVAMREISTRTQGKAFRSITAAFVIVIVGGLILAQGLSGNSGPNRKFHIGLTSGAASVDHDLRETSRVQGVDVETRHYSNATDAAHDLQAGTITAVLDDNGTSYRLTFSKRSIPEIVTLASTATTRHARRALLTSDEIRSVDEAARRATVAVATEDAPPGRQLNRLIIAYVAVMVLSMAILISGQMIAQGVAEEKSNHVVEIVISAINPLQLLTGKILGIGILTLGQVTIYSAAGTVTAGALGMLHSSEVAYTVVAASLVWLIIGYALFGILYAAAASLVSRREDISVATAPLTLLSTAMIYSGMFSVQSPDATWVHILSYIPPFSITMQPMLIATASASAIQSIVAALIGISACLVSIVGAARIYTNSILHSGSRRSWGAALRMD